VGEVAYWMIPAASGAITPKVWTWAITSSIHQLEFTGSTKLTSPLLFFLSSNLHLLLIKLKVGFHLLNSLVGDR
jgi:hypothetical protein